MTWGKLKKLVKSQHITDNMIIVGFRDRSKSLKDCVVIEPWIVFNTSRDNKLYLELPIQD